MADLSSLGNDEDFTDLYKLNDEVVSNLPPCSHTLILTLSQHANPDEYSAWEKLVTAAESLEGGLNRNSSPQAITAVRAIYDRFLAKYPLFFGYWRKYADLEFSIGGTEAAEMVYERGIASIPNSVDLWTHYCTFKMTTNHNNDITRE